MLQYQIQAQDILFEDDVLIAVNKASGLPSQALRDSDCDHLYAALQRYLTKGAYLGLHHRLDLQTSGVVLFTKSRSVNAKVAALFRDSLIHKRYEAIAFGAPSMPEQFVAKSPIAAVRNSSPQRFSCNSSGGKNARTEYFVKNEYVFGDTSVYDLEALPITGRTHQIRVHLESFSLRIIGDKVYGSGRLPMHVRGIAPRRMCLHAQSLSFPHPISGEAIEIIAPKPEEFTTFLNRIAKLCR
ncbi:MAG: RluA family pseudouridine synthase [Bradymonadales bacterium]|jgi:RluA family pseudouridine synthase